MLIDRRNRALHRPWIALAGLATIASCAWFGLASRGDSQWPTGSSPPGLTFGVVGGAIILFEFALWGRKKIRRLRVGPVRTWMAAHIWLGLLTVPLIVLHAGFRLGGSLSTALMVLFAVVILSGVWGLALQQVLPSRMLQQVLAETIYSQIDRLVGIMVDDAARLVNATCGPLPGEEADEEELAEVAQGAPVTHMTVGAVQTVGSVQGKVLVTRAAQAAVLGAEPLRDIFRNSIAPYLLQGRRSRSPLALPSKAGAIFRDIRTRIPAEAHDTVATLENLCDQRRQLDRQARIHRWLHNWLGVHLPLSIALVVLMFVHIWVALKYR